MNMKKRILSGVMAVATMASMVGAIGASADRVEYRYTPTTYSANAPTYISSEYDGLGWQYNVGHFKEEGMANGVKYRVQEIKFKSYYDRDAKKEKEYPVSCSTTYEMKEAGLDRYHGPTAEFVSLNKANCNQYGYNAVIKTRCKWGTCSQFGYNAGAERYKIDYNVMVKTATATVESKLKCTKIVDGKYGSSGYEHTLYLPINKCSGTYGRTWGDIVWVDINITPIDSDGHYGETCELCVAP